MKKNFKTIIILTIMLFTLTGCGNKKEDVVNSLKILEDAIIYNVNLNVQEGTYDDELNNYEYDGWVTYDDEKNLIENEYTLNNFEYHEYYDMSNNNVVFYKTQKILNSDDNFYYDGKFSKNIFELSETKNKYNIPNKEYFIKMIKSVEKFEKTGETFTENKYPIYKGILRENYIKELISVYFPNELQLNDNEIYLNVYLIDDTFGGFFIDFNDNLRDTKQYAYLGLYFENVGINDDKLTEDMRPIILPDVDQ